jgi:hypothetical protein
MLTVRHVNTGHMWPELKPVWLWRVFVRDEPEREVIGIRATQEWGALRCGAQALGVNVCDVEAEVLPKRI